MAITPEQILERIRNNQADHDAAFERLYKLPNGDYHDPLSYVAAGQQPVTMSRHDALNLFESELSHAPEPGHTMTCEQANLVQRYRPQYVAENRCRQETANEQNMGLVAKIVGAVGLAALAYGTLFFGGVDEHAVMQKYQQYQKIDRSIKLEDVARREQESSDRGKGVFQLGGLVFALGSAAYLALRRKQQP